MIIVRIWEGLGNQMFQYAYARALKEEGRDVYLDLNKSYDNVLRKERCNTKRISRIQNFKISLPSINMYSHKKYFFLNQSNTLKKNILVK